MIKIENKVTTVGIEVRGDETCVIIHGSGSDVFSAGVHLLVSLADALSDCGRTEDKLRHLLALYGTAADAIRNDLLSKK
ncbi:hypothetical protein K250101E9_48400 [Enterocloster aldenensis]|uniref:hypothetical protein n=1 Tax=Enterocloster aldenensis TaxID=358742 RepID=UPI0034C1AB8E